MSWRRSNGWFEHRTAPSPAWNIGVILGLCWGYIGVILGLCWGYIGVMLGLYWGYIRVILVLY